MTDEHRHPLRRANVDRAKAQDAPDTPQTRAPAYRLAFTDDDFMCRDELRPVRLQLELLKPELLLDAHGIQSTIVLFGGARIPEPAEKHTARTKTLADLSRFYDETRTFARLMTEKSMESGGTENVIVTGGGPGVMEAGNRGALDAGGHSIGLNIVLPFEQAPNEYVTPELCFNFHYFAIRKMHFLMRARAICVFPGGFGTMDELFEMLTLIQTGKQPRIPVVLYGKNFWERLINFDVFVEMGLIAERDIDLFHRADSVDDAFDFLTGALAQDTVTAQSRHG